jgi:hypothetical protein
LNTFLSVFVTSKRYFFFTNKESPVTSSPQDEALLFSSLFFSFPISTCVGNISEAGAELHEPLCPRL